jgi:very-short-patch-repair endonuclease
VLRRLVREPEALGRVARQALELLHFGPDAGTDLRRAPGARYDCEAACYDCLLSYRNQRDHLLLDRQLAAPLLFALRDATVSASPDDAPRRAKLDELRRQCDSKLEEEFLDMLDAYDLALPTHAQKLIEYCNARPDFLYGPDYLAVFVDGPVHDSPEQRRHDAEVDARFDDLGYTVVRLRYNERDRWLDLLEAYPSVFGTRRSPGGGS